jgi:hypothetical protein
MYYGKVWKVMEENRVSMGHMTRYCRHVTEKKGNESHGIPWKVMEISRERKMYIITT